MYEVCVSRVLMLTEMFKIIEMLMQGRQYKKNANDKRGLKINLNTKDVAINTTFEKLSFLNEATI